MFLICHNFSSSLNQFIALVLKVVGVGVELYVQCLCAFTYMVHPNNFQTDHMDVFLLFLIESLETPNDCIRTI